MLNNPISADCRIRKEASWLIFVICQNLGDNFSIQISPLANE